MSQTIIIDDKEYVVDTLPDQTKGLLGLMQENQTRLGKAQIDLQLATAAGAKLAEDLKASLKGVKTVPKPRVSTKPKSAAKN